MENRSVNSDLELFTRPLEWDTRTTISKIYSPVLFGGFGFCLAVLTNYFQRRPMLSGIQRHVAFIALGIPAGIYADQILEKRHAKRDAALIYYMKTHPDDFPPVERVKYKDILEKWLPRR